MNLVCRLVERSVAASVARGDEPRAAWVRFHLKRCSACRQVHADMDAIRRRLAEALDSPEPSDAFLDRVWAGIDADAPAPKRHRYAHLGIWAATGASALALVLAVTFVRDGTQGTDQSGTGRRSAMAAHDVASRAQEGARQTGQARRKAKAKPAAEPRPTDKIPPAQDALIRRLIVQRRRLARMPTATEPKGEARGSQANRGRSIRMASGGSAGASPSPAGSTSPAGSPSPGGSPSSAATPQPTLGWVDIARYYELQNDASSAAYAYRQALREKTDADTAYAAGRTSEAAGDILAAVECLAEMLAGPPAASSTDGDGVSHRPGGGLGPDWARHCSFVQRAGVLDAAGSRIWLGRVPPVQIVFRAVRTRDEARNGSPVFGFGSHPGALLDVT